MKAILKLAAGACVGIPCLLLLLHTLVRVVRRFHKFPIPYVLANAIDNPFRRWIQPPDDTPARHGLEPRMKVLEVGPGSGTYTMATARWVGEEGIVVTVDIEPRMVEQVERRAAAEGVENVEARVADVYDLPFEDATFDAVTMIAVIGEIPEPERAMLEFRRVLSPVGILVFSELLFDPDYARASTLVRMVTGTGFRLREKVGSLFYYTLIFEKVGQMG